MSDEFAERALREIAQGTEPNSAFRWNREAQRPQRPRSPRTEIKKRELERLTPYLNARDGDRSHQDALADAAKACGVNERTIERTWKRFREGLEKGARKPQRS